MTRVEDRSLRRGTLLGVATVLALTIAAALLALGIALFVAGLLTWVHRGHVASAWARTLAGVGLIGGGACLAALGSLTIGWLRIGRMGSRWDDAAVSRLLKFAAVIGFLVVLICLPFGAAIQAAAHGPWFGWGR
jgi:uncharacterized sodium:solute symporter family permease YidK